MTTAKDLTAMSPRAAEALANVDPNEPVRHGGTLSGEGLKQELDAGRLVPVTRRRPRAPLPAGHARIGSHICTPDEVDRRSVPRAVSREIFETGKLPPGVVFERPRGTPAPQGARLTFGPIEGGRFGVPSFMDHPPFRPARMDSTP